MTVSQLRAFEEYLYLQGWDFDDYEYWRSVMGTLTEML